MSANGLLGRKNVAVLYREGLQPKMTGTPLDWRRIRVYLANDITWMRGRLALGDIDSALYTIRVVRSYLRADIDSHDRFS